MKVVLLNFAHPLTTEQQAQLGAQLGAPPEVRTVPAHVDRSIPLAQAARSLADAAQLSVDDWQTLPLVINPPSLAPLALALIAEIHGRRGDFPPILNVRPVAGSLPTRYEIAEILNLQAVREAARRQR
jgi:hypothetical protein